ncbi:hypothetical protein V6767_09465 [Martelella sp. FLE1502]
MNGRYWSASPSREADFAYAASSTVHRSAIAAAVLTETVNTSGASAIDRESTRCLFVTGKHGAEEALVQPNPLKQALTNFEQAGSSNKTFFPIEDRRLGGLEHCQVDNKHVAREVVLNWLCSIGLGPSAPRAA